MPRKIPAATNWRPLNVFKVGSAVYRGLPAKRIQEQLAKSFPNWDIMNPSEQAVSYSLIMEAFIYLKKSRRDTHSAPRLATVKANLARLQHATTECLAAIDAMDPRTATVFKNTVGAKPRTKSGIDKRLPDGSPIGGSNFARGHRRVQILKLVLADAQQWTTQAQDGLPRQDPRQSDEPGLPEFASKVGHIWENYAGLAFTASKNRGAAPEFILGVLQAGGLNYSEHAVLVATRAAVKERDDKFPNNIVVAREDRNLSLGELVRRASLPKKGKRFATG